MALRVHYPSIIPSYREEKNSNKSKRTLQYRHTNATPPPHNSKKEHSLVRKDGKKGERNAFFGAHLGV